MSRISSFIDRMGESATLSTRILGAVGRDAVTNWQDVTWSTSTIKIFVDEAQTREVDSVEAGRITEKRMKAFVRCGVTVNHMDRITYHSRVYEVESVETPEYLYGNLQFQRVVLVLVTE